MRFTTAVRRDPAVADWMRAHPGELGALAQRWFETMRACGDDVRELLHDGFPTACVGDTAFAYVAAFKGHVNVGFFRGAELPDPHALLEGTGKSMRHAKLRPGAAVDEAALLALVRAAYQDMQRQLAAPADEHREVAAAFFDEFVQAFTSFSGKVISQRYATPSLAMRADGTSALHSSAEAVASYFQQVVDDYHRLGVRRCRYRELEAVPLGRAGMLATVTWELLDEPGAVVESWRESYVLALRDGHWTVTMSVDH